LATSDQALQNFASCLEMPLSLGSANASSTRSSAVLSALASPRRVFCARNCTSRKASRRRRNCVTSTPVPSSAALPAASVRFAPPPIWRASDADISASWRV
jgi:hypothetical protein